MFYQFKDFGNQIVYSHFFYLIFSAFGKSQQLTGQLRQPPGMNFQFFNIFFDTDIMAEDESYEIYCVYEEEIVVTGKIEDGIYQHFYNTTVDSDKGWWQGSVQAIDGTGDDARTSIGNYSVKVK